MALGVGPGAGGRVPVWPVPAEGWGVVGVGRRLWEAEPDRGLVAALTLPDPGCAYRPTAHGPRLEELGIQTQASPGPQLWGRPWAKVPIRGVPCCLKRSQVWEPPGGGGRGETASESEPPPPGSLCCPPHGPGCSCGVAGGRGGVTDEGRGCSPCGWAVTAGLGLRAGPWGRPGSAQGR